MQRNEVGVISPIWWLVGQHDTEWVPLGERKVIVRS